MSRLVDEGKIDLIRGSRDVHMPSHCFYVTDLMVYWKDKPLKALFSRYDACSGQIINTRKSSFHYGGINQNRMAHIVNFLGFTIGYLPFTYLQPLFVKVDQK